MKWSKFGQACPKSGGAILLYPFYDAVTKGIMRNKEKDVINEIKPIRKICIGKNLEMMMFREGDRNLFMSSEVTEKFGYRRSDKLLRSIREENKILLPKKIGNYCYTTWYIDDIGILDIIFSSRKDKIISLRKYVPKFILDIYNNN